MKLIKILFTTILLLVATNAFAQDTFTTIESCNQLKLEIEHAVKTAAGLETLLTDETLGEEQYLSQLYEGVKILSLSGEMFFRASDRNESTCKNVLNEKNKIEEFIGVYDLYLKPSQMAYQFFRRAREAAIRLNRQHDVEKFNTAMTEYDSAVMKLASVCESDLAGSTAVSQCASLNARLADTLK